MGALAWRMGDQVGRPPPVRHEITGRTIGVVLLTIAVAWLAIRLADVFLVIIVALILVGTIDPLVAWLERRGFRRGPALGSVFLVLTLTAVALLTLMVPAVVSQILQLTTEAPKARNHLVTWLSQFESASSLVKSAKSFPVEDLMAHAGTTVLGYSAAVFTAIGYTVTTIFLAIYLLADPTRAKGMLYAVVPRHHHIKVARILIELEVIVGGYMRGQLITSVSIAVFVFGLLTVLGVENALPLALFAGFTDVIPFVGGLIASAPVILAVSGHGGATMAIVAALMLVYQEFESRILVPRVYGKVLRLSPAIVIIALLVGGTLLGILGALLAVPIAAGIQMLIRELRVEMPGEVHDDGSVRAKDQREERIYEQLSQGATAADAGVIAGALAEKANESDRTEQERLTAAATPDDKPAI